MSPRMEMDADPEVIEFLQRNPRLGRPGGKCQTCRHPKREAIDRACRTYWQAVAEGKTMIPWDSFFETFVRGKHGIITQPVAVLRHLRNCLGLQAGS